jgi:hypothetical protein
MRSGNRTEEMDRETCAAEGVYKALVPRHFRDPVSEEHADRHLLLHRLTCSP